MKKLYGFLALMISGSIFTAGGLIGFAMDDGVNLFGYIALGGFLLFLIGLIGVITIDTVKTTDEQ